MSSETRLGPGGWGAFDGPIHPHSDLLARIGWPSLLNAPHRCYAQRLFLGELHPDLICQLQQQQCPCLYHAGHGNQCCLHRNCDQGIPYHPSPMPSPSRTQPSSIRHLNPPSMAQYRPCPVHSRSAAYQPPYAESDDSSDTAAAEYHRQRWEDYVAQTGADGIMCRADGSHGRHLQDGIHSPRLLRD